MYDVTNFFVGLMIISPYDIKAIKKDLYSSSSENILIRNYYWLMSELYFCLINSTTISFQYCISFFLFCQITL